MNKLEISKEDLKFNIASLKNIINNSKKDDNGNKLEVIAVVKGNAMGLGLTPFSKFLLDNGIRILAVANLEELVALREAKIDSEILMLTPTSNEKELKLLIENKATITIGSLEELEIAEKILEDHDLEINAHIKIDTGLGRYGFLSDNTDILDCFEKAKRVHIKGMYTHFSKPIDERWTRQQFNRFLDVVAGVKSSGYTPGILHVCATTAFLKYPEMHLNAVRLGSYFQGRVLVKDLALKKIGTYKTVVQEIKTVSKGYNISYSNAYKTRKETKIATIPTGYMNGLAKKKVRDSFSFKDNIISVLMEIKKIFKDNSFKVEINGKEYKIIGRIGMYHAEVDITGSDVKVGDEVIIKTISPLEISENIKREYN